MLCCLSHADHRPRGAIQRVSLRSDQGRFVEGIDIATPPVSFIDYQKSNKFVPPQTCAEHGNERAARLSGPVKGRRMRSLGVVINGRVITFGRVFISLYLGCQLKPFSDSATRQILPLSYARLLVVPVDVTSFTDCDADNICPGCNTTGST